jgi:hypothetical protein
VEEPGTETTTRTARAPGSGRVAERGGLLLATVTLRVPATTWTGPFSRRHPEVVIEILARSETGRQVLVADHWIGGRPAGVWAPEIADFPDVLKVDTLAEVGDGALYRVKFRAPPVVDLYRKLEMPLPFPIRIQAGYVRWEVAARRAAFDAILRFVRELDPKARVAWTRTPRLRSHLPLLSPSQRRLLDRAIQSGYFAVPRKVTLGELARATNRSKAAVSEALARIEKKLLESAVRGPLLRG